jgi:hypothetical protein
MKITRKNHNWRWNEEILEKVIFPRAKKYESVAVYLEILALEDALREYGDDEAVKALLQETKALNKNK